MSKKTRFTHRSVKLFESPLTTKKYRAVFYYDNEPFHYVDFGGKNYRDFTLINDPDSKYYIPDKKEREKVRENYIARHGATEEYIWKTDPYAPATLSRWVLWNMPTLEASWNDYKQRFNLQ